MVTQTMLGAVVLRPTVRRWCAECGRSLGATMLRVVWKEDGKVYTAFYCPQIDDNEEVRGCAPDHPLTRKALGRTA